MGIPLRRVALLRRVKTKGERDKEQQDENRRRSDNNGFHAV
jgi:hypothetical protein